MTDVVEPKILPAVGGTCAPGADARVWEASSTFEVGEWYVGVRSDTAATDDLLRRVFAKHVVDVEAPANFSVVLDPGSGERGVRQLHQLIALSELVARSRHRGRIVHALAAHLSQFAGDATDDVPASTLRTADLGAVVGDRAYLLPRRLLRSLRRLQPRLHRLGVRLVDGSVTTIDAATAELVVPEPALELDDTVLGELDAEETRSREPGRVLPGRYPLRAWVSVRTESSGEQLSRARAVGATVASVQVSADERREVMEGLADLFARIPCVTVSLDDVDSLVRDLDGVVSAA